MDVRNQFKMQFKSIAENVAFARVTVAAFAAQLEYTLNDLEEIKVAVSEAVTNALVHGYDNDPEQFVFITVSITTAGIEIVVEDQGRGIDDINQALQPAYSTAKDRMGLGFVFMQSFMDRMQVDSTVGKGTIVTMFKKSKQAAGHSEH